MARLVLVEGADKVTAFVHALERHELDESSSSGSLQATLGISEPRLRAYREALRSAENVDDLVIALRAAEAVATAMASQQSVVQLAWTFPGDSSPGVRTTGGVAREIIDGSRSNLLVVGFAVTVDPSLTGLAAQTVDAIAAAAARGVMITAVLHRTVNRNAFLRMWRRGVPLPAVFTWPAGDDEMASMHAKLVVADRLDALLTSANLTYHGFERNLEMGVRVSGRTAGEIHDRIHSLIAAGHLVPWID